jgi:thioredoxin 1
MIKQTSPEDVLSATRRGTVVVDFWAPDCGRCHALTAQFETLLDLDPDLGEILAVNAREAPDFAESLGVMSLPTILIFKDGVEVRRYTDPVLSTTVVSEWRTLRAS